MNALRKSILLATTGVALAAPVVQAQIAIGEGLSVTGFIDMSATISDPDVGAKTESAGLDQFEVDFLYDFGEGLSAQVDLEYQDNGTGEEVDIEQAFINYAFSDALSAKAGRFLSYSGWETEEPTGLFQYSGTGYAKYFYGGYQQGVSGMYSSDMLNVTLSLVNDLGDLEGEARDFGDLGVEAGLHFMPTEDITAKLFYMTDEGAGGEDTVMTNFWAAYSGIDSLTLAAEYNVSENTGAAVGIGGVDAEADGYLLMANYGWDKWALTLRYHAWEVETAAGVVVEDMSGITLSPSYALSDNLLFVFEYRMDDDGLGAGDVDTLAVEALLTF